ncbi:MAG: hypothetical protein R6W68_15380 [Ignavibacteriaceae bacterium]
MSQFLRIVLLVFLFLFLFKIVKRFLIKLFNNTAEGVNKGSNNRREKKYENIEEAKYTDISETNEKEKKNS